MNPASTLKAASEGSGEDSGGLVASSVMWLTAASASKVHAQHDFGKSHYRRVMKKVESAAGIRITRT
jgi:hypothetical protein